MKYTDRMERIRRTVKQLEGIAEDLVLLTDSKDELHDKAFDALYLAQHLKKLSKPNRVHELALTLQEQGYDVDIVPHYSLKRKRAEKL
ncbi:hypothetical protein [Priestia endophytica]|uniref:hypothetical protein n=1 Tax=Priestia endophytica TaxID=135735 RepID=UPI000DCA6B62|nr:hypothetical protein [Priestia endophytica]RAS75709.1 hypothetical protein A4R27_21910 [Priestia endophytica]